MNEPSVRSVNAYWANVFGCGIDDLRPTHGRAYTHAGFAGYHGVHAMMFDEAAPIVSVPEDRLSPAQQLAALWRPGSIRLASQFVDILDGRAERVIGPAVLTYGDASTLPAWDAVDEVRLLEACSDTDRQQVLALSAACSSDEWEAGGSDLDHDTVFGAFAGASLAAVAGYEVWGGRIAHIAIVTHPAHRGRAFGTAAVLAAAKHAVSNGLVPQYRTLESNTPSRRIAAKLGFVPFAMSLAVRTRA